MNSGSSRRPWKVIGGRMKIGCGVMNNAKVEYATIELARQGRRAADSKAVEA